MADVPGKFYRATKVRTGVSPSSAGSIEGEPLPPVNPPGSSLNSVGLTMPSAFTVSNSPLTANGTIGVAGAGTVAQYIRGDGSLADFPESSGGGGSVNYYLNGSVDQGTIGGVAYKEINKVPILGAGTQFSISADGYIASFLTDVGDPNLLEIPGGNWNFETYFSSSSSGGTPTFYVELYKYDGTTFTLISSSVTSPEFIAFGTTLTPYFSTLAVPTTALALTDRLAVRYYVTHSGRTITLHTENNTLCQIITTFTTGLTALNGLTAQVQNFAVGTTGTDFNIASAVSTHTFNLPTASATNRGALSSADWALFTQAYNDKINSAAVTGTTTKTLTLTQQDGGTITASWSDLNTDAVLSVFGRTGNVIAVSGDYTTAQVTESGNLYYTDARSRAALSFAAGSGAYNTSTGVITIPTNNNQIANGAGYITSAALAGYLPLTGGALTGPLTSSSNAIFKNASGFALKLDSSSSVEENDLRFAKGGVDFGAIQTHGTTGDFEFYVNIDGTGGGYYRSIILKRDSTKIDFLISDSINTTINSSGLTSVAFIKTGGTSAQFLKANGSVDSTIYVSNVTASSPLFSSGGATPNITIQQASGSQSGFLSSTDWTTFNNKQNALTNPVTGTGSAGQVAYWSSGSAITGESNLFWDATNDRLGIGLSNPSQPLEVLKSQNADSAIQVTNTNSGNAATAQFFADNGTTRTQFFHTGTGYNTSGVLEANQGGLYNTTSAGIALVAAGASGILRFATGGLTERMRIFSDGNVLIQSGGTFTNNGARLQVNGTAYISNTLTTDGSLVVRNTNISQASILRDAIVTNGTTIGILRFGARFNSTTYGTGADISTSAVGTWSSSNYGTNLVFSTVTQNTDVNTARMTILHNGNVGIGTPSPSEKLDVVGGGLAAGNGTIKTGITYSTLGLMGTFSNHDLGILTNGSIKATITSTGEAFFSKSVQAYSFVPVGTNPPSSGMYAIAPDGIAFSTNTTNRMTITGNGRVLIGGVDNGAILSIAGGRTFINTGQTGLSTAAYTSFNSLTFNDDYSNAANGPNKIITYGRGTTWVGGLGIHDDTQAYYAGGTHKWYKYNGTTATLNLSLDGSGNLTTSGTIKTAALDGGYVAGTWKLGRAILGTQPSETYQIIVEINGQLYAIGAANI
jgi:hypothetical protein